MAFGWLKNKVPPATGESEEVDENTNGNEIADENENTNENENSNENKMGYGWLKNKIPGITLARGDSGEAELDKNTNENEIGITSVFDVSQALGFGTEVQGRGEETIDILIEIVSAFNVPDGKVYVLVEFGDKEVHKTEKIKSNEVMHPIWTIETGSLFLLKNVPEEKFKDSDGLHFVIKDSKQHLIGLVYVDSKTLLNGKGERLVFEVLKQLNNDTEKDTVKTELYLRCKRADKEDMNFLDFYRKNKKSTGVFKDQSFLPFQRPDSSFMQQSTHIGPEGEIKYRVKPYANPNNEEETSFLTEKQINEVSMQQSTKWIEAGSGSLGKLFFELIGCDDIKGLDTTSQSDAFACIVYEDTMVETDVINNTKFPRWLPWTQRAFVFNIMHPSSTLLIGLFDYDSSLLPNNSHDQIGRVIVSPTNFKSNTIYTLQYDLYHEEIGLKRKATGTIIFRMRLEWNERTALMIGRSPPPALHVTVQEKTHFKIGHFTVQGISGDHTFALDTITWYIQELKSYTAAIEYIVSAIEIVVFWRGHYDLPLGCCKVTLPLHSIVAFVWGICVVENFNLLPAFWVFCVSWALLATMEYQRNHPSPWHRCKSYRELFWIFLLNWAGPGDNIPANANIEAITAYNEAVEEKNKKLEQHLEEQKKMEEEMNQELADLKQDASAVVDENLASEKGDTLISKMNLLRPILYPVQKALSGLVVSLRVVKSIILWDESYYSFWIVSTCLILTVILVWIPWSFIIRWTLRICVWIFLGPWMKLVDIFYLRKKQANMTEEEKWLAKEKAVRDNLKKLAVMKRITNENVQKMRVFTRFLFGKYMISVPQFKQECFLDYPLPSSFSEPYDKDSTRPVTPVRKIMGQRLVGDMIPKRDSQDVSVFLQDERKVTSEEGGADEKQPLLSTGVGADEEYGAVE